MREITTHRVNTLNECISVQADDDGCNYRISGVQGPLDHHPIPTIGLRFQNGPVMEVGANGITNECLLAIIIDRLESFQRGKFSCRENALALTKLEEAAHWLHARTRQRQERGVEGTHEV
jgi:hypothetical protein